MAATGGEQHAPDAAGSEGGAVLFGTMRGIVAARNALLALLSVALCVAACEAALRLFHPRYEFAATPPRGPWVETQPVSHPDTGAKHRVIYNNLDGRQSRDFPAGSLDAAVNIAFFGDSETQNVFMPAQYSYTEPLDYLLNAAAPGGGELAARSNGLGRDKPAAPPKGTAFNVLNFGAWGWGPGRSYLRWRTLPVRRELAHVFYLVVDNDLDDLKNAIDAGVVRIGASGEIWDGGPPRTPAWKRVLARSHLTYLALDAWQRVVKPPAGRPETDAARRRRRDLRLLHDETWPVFRRTVRHAERLESERVKRGEASRLVYDETWPVFRELVRRWKREVEADGGAFHVALMPKDGSLYRLVRGDAALRAEIRLVDLRECFEETVPGFGYEDWRFVNDPHWSPAGNMVAATCFYRYLEDVLDLPKRGDEELAHARHAYYKAFLHWPGWKGQRYMPDAAWARPPDHGDNGVRGTGEAVVARYLALELAMDDQWRGAVRAARAAGAVATRAGWDVYANLQERLLVYVKSPCPAEVPVAGRFFLHVVPFTPEKLPADRRRSGFVNLDFGACTLAGCSGPVWPLRRLGNECVFSARLPDYPLTTVRTGRFESRVEGADIAYTNLWSEEFRMPLARSVWEVTAGASGRGLDYVKSPCRAADTKPRFFLHVFPLRPADLRGRPASGVLRRYANLDFAWGETGVKTGDACRISATLPDFPIDFVRTGQFRDGIVSAKRFWSARIDFAEVERARSPPGGDVDGA